MSDYAIMPYQDYKDSCDVIREKTGGTALIRSGEMAELIAGIEGSGENLDAEISAQEELLATQDAKIAELAEILAGKASGGMTLPTLANEGTAEDLVSGKQLIDQEGNIVEGTHVCSEDGTVPVYDCEVTFSVLNDVCYGWDAKGTNGALVYGLNLPSGMASNTFTFLFRRNSLFYAFKKNTGTFTAIETTGNIELLCNDQFTGAALRINGSGTITFSA